MPELGSAGLPGGPGSGGRSRPPRPAPRPRPRPPSHSIFGGIGRAISHVGAEVQHATRVASRPAPSHPSRNTSEAASGGGYGSAQANAYKGSAAYRQAIVDVFRHQATAQQSAIVKGALKAPSYEGKVVLDYLRSNPQTYRAKLAQLGNPGAKPAIDIGNVLATAGRDLYKSLNRNDFRNSVESGRTPAGEQLLAGAGAGLSKLIQHIPTGVGMPAEQRGLAQESGLGPGQLGKNFAKDLVNTPAEVFPTLSVPIAQAAQGHFGAAANTFLAPYKEALKHPTQFVAQHPFDAYLMFGAPVHGGARLAAAPVRALAPESAAGRAVSIQREGAHLTGNLTHERPHYSLSPVMKAQQVSVVERQLYKRAPTGELVPKTRAIRSKLIRRGVADLVAGREMIRRVNREGVRAQREGAIRPSRPKRAGHAAKTALSYDPGRAAIPGAEVLARIADLTVRKPGTYLADLQKHLSQVAATRPALVRDFPKDFVKEHDAYVKAIQGAIDKAPRSPKAMKAIFDAAEKYRQEYGGGAELAAWSHGHFGTMSKDALQRRSLMHYAVTHMGARMDAERGLLDAVGRPLSNTSILEHIKGPEGTGGRLPAYTPDRPRSGSAYYVSGERRPMPLTAKNTLFAYTHGLTEPGHEALTEQHVLMQGVVDSHRGQNDYLETLSEQLPGGGFGKTYKEAERVAPPGYTPINIAQPFHPQASLDKALEGLDPATMEEEAARHGLDLNERLRPDSPGGRWALIDRSALKALREQQGMISPNTFMRVVRGLNTQFRAVALGTSMKHVPGVTAENLIRDISYGVGFRSWLTGRKIVGAAEQINPTVGKEIRTKLTGGQVAGSTELGRTYSVAAHYEGTNLYPVLKAFEATMKAPGARQLRTAWLAWSKLVIRGVKKALEEQHQIADIGKIALREHGYAEAYRRQGMVGAVQRLLTLHGRMLDDAAKGLFDPAKARQYRAGIQQIRGHWTDLTPTGKTALMFSPFGLWWMNSVRFIARMPVDQPVKTGLLASATVSTEPQRQREGLDLLSPNALPAYMQGGIPAGGKVIAQNYYSPFGIANDPLETGSSLIQPWATVPLVLGPLGLNWLGHPLESPGNPKGRKPASAGERAQYILDSILSSFLPLYTKAKQVAQGGASAYDVSPNWPAPATKTPGHGAGAGLAKALQPFRSYKKASGGGGGKVSVPGFSGGGGNVAVPGFSSGGRGGGDVAIPGF